MTARDLGSDVSGSMVERVRAAILAAIGDKVLLDEDGETLIDGYIDAAAVSRAAIEAMREPTGGMRQAGFISGGSQFEPDEVWQGMIDAALSSAEQT